jgi:hypothetical protein
MDTAFGGRTACINAALDAPFAPEVFPDGTSSRPAQHVRFISGFARHKVRRQSENIPVRGSLEVEQCRW